MKSKILIVTMVFCCTSLAIAQSKIAGQVKDSAGAVIPSVRILIHWDPAGSDVGLSDNVGIQHDVIVMTDANGTYSAELPSGFYDVFVSATSFTPSAAKIRVKKDQDFKYEVWLKIDPLISRELGDHF